MNKKIRIGTLFSGIGAVEQALKRMDKDHEIVFACDNGDINIEYDKDLELEKIKSLKTIKSKKEYVDNLYQEKTRRTNFVKKSYLANYNLSEEKFYLDVKLFDGIDFHDELDLLVGGSPCQSFSIVGSQNGLDDTRGTLFYDFARILGEIKPKVFIFENVRGLLNHDKGVTWEVMKKVFSEQGYVFYEDLLNSEDYGIPQTRRRVFVVGFRNDLKLEQPFKFPKPINLEFDFPQILLTNVKEGNFISKDSKIKLIEDPGFVDPKYILSPKLKKYVMSTGTKGFSTPIEIDKKIARTVLSTMGNRHRAGVDNYMTDLGKIRMLTEREALRLMGFPDDFKIVVSRAQVYKQAGNSIVVDVLIHILNEIYSTGVFT